MTLSSGGGGGPGGGTSSTPTLNYLYAEEYTSIVIEGCTVMGISLSCAGCHAVVKDSILAQPEFTDNPGGINPRIDSGFASLEKVYALMDGNSWRSITRLDVSNSKFTRHVNDKGQGGRASPLLLATSAVRPPLRSETEG